MKATIIDVRSKLEYTISHSENSINIPLNKIDSSVEKIKSFNTPLVLCCMSGGRSGQALDYLKSKGLKNLHNAGNWKNAESMAESL